MRTTLGSPISWHCSKCGEPNDRFRQRYCSSCNAAYQRKWRLNQKRVERAYRKLLRRALASVSEDRLAP